MSYDFKGNDGRASGTGSRPFSTGGLSAADICHIAIFTAIIAVLAQLSVPLPGGVPLTLQTFAIMLSGVVLGAKKGTMAVIVYIILGAVGAPVFAGFKGGLASIAGVTGGFIISFWVIALTGGTFSEWAERNASGTAQRYAVTAAGLFIGAAFNYTFGVFVYVLATGNSVGAAVAACVAPFVVTDLIKIALADWAGTVLRRNLRRAGLIVQG